MEEIIYVDLGPSPSSGWTRASRPLGPGESAHIPRDVVHGTYNAGDETLVFLAILSPAIFEGPGAGRRLPRRAMGLAAPDVCVRRRAP